MRWGLILLACAAAAGCSTTEYVQEHPVTQAAPALKPGVYPLRAVDVRPIPTHEVEPDYPPELGSILTGKATVVFTVLADGKVTDASVLQADDVLFGEAAVAAVSKWRFRPATIKSAPVACRVTLPFIFTSPYGYYLQGQGPDSSPDEPPSGSPPATDVAPQ